MNKKIKISIAIISFILFLTIFFPIKIGWSTFMYGSCPMCTEEYTFTNSLTKKSITTLGCEPCYVKYYGLFWSKNK
jgi:hypothetical protein